jgi:hypothetical protein
MVRTWGVIGVLLLYSAHPAFSAEPPTFDQYKVNELFDKNPAPIDVKSHPRAKRYKEALSASASQGPNFAGHYRIVTWGCGTACLELAIVDLENGRVIFPGNLKRDYYQGVRDGSEPFSFRKDSALLVVAGSPNNRERLGLHYFLWKPDDLMDIYEIRHSFSPTQ